MALPTRTGREAFTWISIDSPLIWLVYLPFFFLPWYFNLPSMPQMASALTGVAIFLLLYVQSIGAQGWRRVGFATGVLVLSFLLAFTDSNWTVITVYAAAMIGELRPVRRAAMGLGAFAVTTLVVGIWLHQTPLFWAPGVLLVVMVGLACISRSLLEDKNLALANAQDEVRQMAATAERERIGRDLHDLLGRSLTLIAIKADLASKLASFDPVRAGAEMREVAGTAREALSEVRAAVAGMTGASLVRELASARMALAAAGITCTTAGDVEGIDAGAGAVLAMTLREAVTNVIRHSGAGSCQINVSQHAGCLELLVRDDGNGTMLREGGGIRGIRSRLAAAGGGLSITADTQGTRLVARIPTGVPA